jgi:hypothetical protein
VPQSIWHALSSLCSPATAPSSMKRQNTDLRSLWHRRMWGSAAACAASQACILARTGSPGGVCGQ